MGLTGFARRQEMCCGGLTSVGIVAAEEVLSVSYDEATASYTGLTLRAGAAPAIYEFREDSAYYRQTTKGQSPFVSVRHELSFFLRGTDEASVSALAELLESNESGFVALVRTVCGDVFLVGWSQEFEEERPLRMTAAVADTSDEYDNDSFCRITMCSEDISFARQFTGAIPARMIASDGF